MSNYIKETYLVTVERPEGVSREDMSSFIREAVKDWGGQWPWGHPFFTFFRRKKVTVRRKVK